MPIPERQIHSTTGRRTQGCQQGLEPLPTFGIESLQLRQQREQLLFHSLEGKSSVTGFESTGLAAADQPVVLERELQPHNRCRRATADRQRHRLGE